MSHGLSPLAHFWFIIATSVVLIDLSYVFLRAKGPNATPFDHPFAKIFPYTGWTLYATFDKRYAPNDDVFVVVQSWCNLFECLLQLLALLTSLAGNHELAHKCTLVVCVMVAYKTVMYGMMEYFDNCKFTRHNRTNDLVQMVIFPSSFWIVIPLILAKRSLTALSLKTTAVMAKKIT